MANSFIKLLWVRRDLIGKKCQQKRIIEVQISGKTHGSLHP